MEEDVGVVMNGFFGNMFDFNHDGKNDDEDRWPWKVKAECHSSKFSAEWWDYELRTQELIDEFLEKNPGQHITVAGGDTLGALQWGRDKLQITKEFAQFIIGKMY